MFMDMQHLIGVWIYVFWLMILSWEVVKSIVYLKRSLNRSVALKPHRLKKWFLVWISSLDPKCCASYKTTFALRGDGRLPTKSAIERVHQLGQEWIRALSKSCKKLKHLTQRALSLKSKKGLALILAIVSGFPTNIIFHFKTHISFQEGLFW